MGNAIGQRKPYMAICSENGHPVVGHKPWLVLVNTYFKEKPQTCPNYCIDVHLREGQMVGNSNWLLGQIQTLNGPEKG